MSDLLRVNNLEVEFHSLGGVIKAVNGISFRVKENSTVALVGESGSGKSVTAQSILGILPRIAKITGGEILFDDPKGEVVDLARLDPHSKSFASLRGGSISMIFQEPMTSLSPLHTIGDQIGEALKIHRSGAANSPRETTVKMLQMVGFPNPADAYNTYPFELSGGLRQRAMIAMALICGPSLLIADEPTTALDVTVQAQILKLIKDLQAEIGMSVLIITHDLGVVANVADEVVVVYRGEVMESGTLKDIFENPTHPYVRALFDAIPHFDMRDGERLKPIREIVTQAKALSGTPENVRQQPDKNDTGPMLELRNVSKRFAIRTSKKLFKKSQVRLISALDNVSLSINRGECVGLVGESGCGKSTLSKVVMRAISADEGKVIFNNNGVKTNLMELNAQQLEPLRRNIQYVFQDPFSSLNPRMPIFDIINEPLLIHGIGDLESRRKMVTDLIHLVGLNSSHLNRYPHSFSGGQRQRIVIARALALAPELLICDEPVSALDVSVQAQVLNLLKDLQQQMGLTYLFISHNLAVVDYIAERIAVMCAGRLVELAPRHSLFSNPMHPYTKSLIAAVPYPDPGKPLDFSAIASGKNSNPAFWEYPFGSHQSQEPDLISVGEGHYLRAHESPIEC